ncbi:hypothetical protein ATCC90586_008824 [Pythium insidiosum]|nr:hypothetical protein ATCC90586_008824 [Pythium insidiosum]
MGSLGDSTTRPAARHDGGVILRRQLPRFHSKRSHSFGSELSVEHHEVDQDSAKLAPECLASADALLSGGVHAMNAALGAIVEEGIGGARIPGMEVRFQDVSLIAKVTVSSAPAPAEEGWNGPSLLTPLKQLARKALAREHVLHKDVLRNLTGVFRPGRLTLVLGPPGSGKSALLKILSGRFPIDRNITFSGDISYNDMRRHEIRDRLPRYVAYVDKHDEHYARMTVLETLEFAHRCCTGKELPEWVVRNVSNEGGALDLLNAHNRFAPEVVAKRLGLERVRDTFVGDDAQGVPGILPREKKRLTVGEMAFGLKAVHLLDDIAVGLDATAAYDIVDSLRSMAHHLHRNIVVALQHPTPEMFDLFDDVLVLNDGHILYHGAREDVLQHFEQLGFVCPPRKEVALFLLDLGTPQQAQYTRQDCTGRVPLTPAEFATCFQQSEIFQTTLQYLQTPPPVPESASVGDGDKTIVPTLPSKDEVDRFRISFRDDLALLLRRQWLLTKRNKAFLVARSFMVLLMGVLYGTTFWQLPTNNSQLVLGLLFSCSMFLSLGPAAQLPVFFANRAVFYKQRGANFYRTSSYVFASCVAQLPMLLFETLLFGSLLYWMGGYISSTDRFIVFLVTLFLCQMCFTALIFFFAAASPSLLVAQPIMVIAILVFVLFGGFLITKNNIPSYFSWFYWVNPIAWCIRALSVNQYTAPEFNTCVVAGVDYCKAFRVQNMGQYGLKNFDLDDNTAWIHRSWLFFLGTYVLLSVLSYIWLEFKRYEHSDATITATDMKTLQDRLHRQQSQELEASYDRLEEEMDGYKLHTGSPSQGANGTVGQRRPASQPRDQEELTLVIPRDGSVGFVPVALGFQDLWYSIPAPGSSQRRSEQREELDLLRGVSGFALPGTMTAFMGSRGAGKTTLMRLLAGRTRIKGSSVGGDIFLNGYPATDLALRRCVGYGAQKDVHSESATVREAMRFAATLRQDASISSTEKMVYVEECIDLLGLRPIANKIIRGSTAEEMKRISIGVELAASPSVLCMDEPTSGVDARSALVIMNALRKVADTGRTVICTMHQPSYDVLNLFDSVLLLQRGGQMVFFGETGEESNKLIEYFEGIPGMNPLKPGHNPASWILEGVEAEQAQRVQIHRQRRLLRRQSSTANASFLTQPGGMESPPLIPVDLVSYFDGSDQIQLLVEDLDQDGITRPSSVLPEIRYQKKRAASPMTQFGLLLQRCFRMHWRTPAYNFTRLILSAILALLFGLLYHGTQYDTIRGANGAVGMIFLSVIFFGLIAFNSVVPITIAERAAYYRERGAQTYNALWYALASTTAEIPFVFLSSLVFTAIVFPLVGFEGSNNFAFFWFVVSLHVLVQVYMGQFLANVLPNAQAAAGLGMLLNGVFLLFAGFNPPTSKIPDAYKWLHYISPPSYSISVLTATVMSECPKPGGATLGCKTLKNAPARFANMPVKLYIESIFQMKHDTIWEYVGILCGIMIAFRLLSLLALRYVNYQK